MTRCEKSGKYWIKSGNFEEVYFFPVSAPVCIHFIIKLLAKANIYYNHNTWNHEKPLSIKNSFYVQYYYFLFDRYFWEIVHDFEQKLQRKLLLFSTGSDRIPVGGFKEMKFKITRIGGQNATSM